MRRYPNASGFTTSIAPPFFCTMYVAIDEAIESAKNGTFSITRSFTCCWRASGQTSRRSKTNGSVTAIGFAMSESANIASAITYVRVLFDLVHRTQAMSVSSQKKPQRTSLRSLTQATDSTWSGCSPKSAATVSDRHGTVRASRPSPVASMRSHATRSAFAA